jgi:hypothetical protein
VVVVWTPLGTTCACAAIDISANNAIVAIAVWVVAGQVP